MNRRVSMGAIALALCACQGRGPPANAYKRWTDQWIVRLGLVNVGIYPCPVSDLDPECLKMDPPRRWKGLWYNEFEGSRFCPEPAQQCGPDTPGDKIYLDWSFSFPPKWKGLPLNRVYAVDFIGRRTSVRGNYAGSSYFIMGNRLISLKEIEPPPITAQSRVE